MAKLGLQLYTVKDEVEKDYFGTVRKIAEIGYDGIEFHAGVMEKTSAEYLRGFLDGLKVELAGITFSRQELETDFDKVINFCIESKCTAAVFPWIDEELRTKEGFTDLVDKFNQWGRKFKENGIKFMYHTHGYEFDDLGGTTGMDIFMRNGDPKYIQLEIDVYWIEWAGVDSVEFMEKYGHISPYIHFKDMKDKVSKHDIEVGDGVINMREIAALGKRNNAEWFIVEQEEFDMPPLKSAEISLENLKVIAV